MKDRETDWTGWCCPTAHISRYAGMVSVSWVDISSASSFDGLEYESRRVLKRDQHPDTGLHLRQTGRKMLGARRTLDMPSRCWLRILHPHCAAQCDDCESGSDTNSIASKIVPLLQTS